LCIMPPPAVGAVFVLAFPGCDSAVALPSCVGDAWERKTQFFSSPEGGRDSASPFLDLHMLSMDAYIEMPGVLTKRKIYFVKRFWKNSIIC
jgi:hypothetical protein